MKPTNPRLIISLAAAINLALLWAGASIDLRAASPLPPSAATTPPAATSPTTAPAPAFAAMAYYDQNCAHCHGPQGSFYGPTLGQNLTDKQLEKAVDDMASGAGNAPLAADQLPAVTAFHRALVMRNPYLSVTQMGDDGKWAGEAMPDANVVIVVGDKRIQADSDVSNWTAQLPPGTKPAQVKITAELDGATTTIEPANATYSNADALPPIGKRPK